MTVGSLLDIEIVPGRDADIVEGVQAAEQIRGGLRRAVQNAVEDGDCFGAGDVLVGRVGRAIAVDPAKLIGSGDIVCRPVALDIGEVRVGVPIGIAIAAGDHRGNLRAGDRIARTEIAVRATVDDAELRHGGHSRVVPCLGRNILEGVIGGGVGLAGRIRQEAVEDGSRLGAGDGRVGLERAVGITLDIGVVIFAVEHVRNGARGLRPHGSEGVGIAGLRQIPAIERVAGARRVGKRVILVDLERLLVCERHIVQPG